MGIDFTRIKKGKVDSTRESVAFISEYFTRNIDVFSGKKSLSDKKKESFFSELGILLGANLDINSSFILIVDQANAKDKELYASIYNNLLLGKSLFESMESVGLFSTYDLYSVKMGEASGFIGEVVTELGAYYSRKLKYRRKMVSILSYPLMVLFSAVGTLMFMLIFIVPAFADIFKRTGNELPVLTKIILRLSTNLSGSITLILFLFVVSFAFLFANRNSVWFRRFFSNMLLKMPVFGTLIQVYYLDRFFVSMVLLSKARVNLVNSIGLVGNMIRFYPLELAFSQIEKDIVKGRLLSDCMKDYSLFDKKVITLVKVGEEVNQLGQIFEKLSKQYSDDLDYRVSNLSTVLEPMLIIFVGVIVAIILVAMYMPIFQIGSNF